MKKLRASDKYAFVLCVKTNDSTIQSYVVKYGDKTNTSKIAVVSNKPTDDKFKKFINSLFNEDLLSQQIAELEMKTTENWNCSREVLENLGIKEKILKKVEEEERGKIKKEWNEMIVRIWLFLKQSHPQLAAVLKVVGPLLVIFCASYLLSGIFGNSSVPSSSISIVNSFDVNSIPTMPWFNMQAGPNGSNISFGGGSWQ